MSDMSVAELVGKRCLLRLGPDHRYRANAVEEYRVLELAPSGTWVRVMNEHGAKCWRPVSDVALVEVLKPLRAGHPEGETGNPVPA